jgi:hypothetical protein
MKKLMKTSVMGAALLTLALMSSVAATQELKDIKPSQNLVLKGIGSFFLSGDQHVVNAPEAFNSVSGNAMINQMYVQFMKPATTNAHKEWPIVFMHGGGLSSKCWQTTPDGRMGWDEYFVREGFDTYLAEAVARARSGFDALKYQQVRWGTAACVAPFPCPALPNISITTDAFDWSAFRWGDFATLTPNPGQRFPMNTVGVGPGSNLQFYNQAIPGMTRTLALGSPGPADPALFYNSPSQLAKLSNELGGAILVGHSESSDYPTRAALQTGSAGVRGIIQLETGCFANLTPAHISVLKNIPILIVVADFMTTPQPPASCVTEMNQINGAGGDMTFISLPAIGIHGNGHMMMLDNNNLQVADVLINWIHQHVKPPKG